MSAVEVKNLHKSFGKVHVLRGLDFEIQKGEGVILLGANGCGKSTLMRSICGLTPTDQGEILIQGQSLQKASRRQVMSMRSQVGVVFQKFNLVSNLSVFQNVLYGAMGSSRLGLLGCMAPFASHEKRERVMACLERVSLADKAHHKAEELSGGQQQRVAIARMLMQEPEIVLADEPIASLDPKSGHEVMELLWEVVTERGLTVVCTLHQLDIALQYGERFIGMKAGQVAIDVRRGQVTKEELETLYHGQVRVDAPLNSTTSEQSYQASAA